MFLSLSLIFFFLSQSLLSMPGRDNINFLESQYNIFCLSQSTFSLHAWSSSMDTVCISSFLKDFSFIFIFKTSYAKRLHITVFALVSLFEKSTAYLCLPCLLENIFHLSHYLCMFRLSPCLQFFLLVSVYL